MIGLSAIPWLSDLPPKFKKLIKYGRTNLILVENKDKFLIKKWSNNLDRWVVVSKHVSIDDAIDKFTTLKTEDEIKNNSKGEQIILK